MDLTFGSLDGDDPNLIFGDIRGIQAASNGTIYVLDFQATEVRAYDPDGQYLRTIAGPGEGPGEITEANGILLSGDTLVVIEAGLPVQRVTAEDRSAYVEGTLENWPDLRREAEEVAALMPDVKPILAGMFVDDEGRLWVERVTPSEAPAFYDRYSEDVTTWVRYASGSSRQGADSGCSTAISTPGSRTKWVCPSSSGLPSPERRTPSVTRKRSRSWILPGRVTVIRKPAAALVYWRPDHTSTEGWDWPAGG